MKHLTVVGIIGIKRKRWYLVKMQIDIGNPSLLKQFSCPPIGYVNHFIRQLSKQIIFTVLHKFQKQFMFMLAVFYKLGMFVN